MSSVGTVSSEAVAATNYYGPPYNPFGTSTLAESIQQWRAWWLTQWPSYAYCTYELALYGPNSSNGGEVATETMDSPCGGTQPFYATAYTYDPGKNAGDGGGCNGGEGRDGGGSGSGAGGNGNSSGASCVDSKGAPMAGDPINTSTGNKYLQDDDYTASAWLTFRRFYNSSSAVASTAMGAHWRHSFDRSLEILGTPASTIVMFRPDGKQITFTKTGGKWITDPDIPDVLTETDNVQGVATGYAVFIAALRQLETYDTSGLLQSVTDQTGTGIALTYSTASTSPTIAPSPGLLLTVTDPKDRQLDFTYDSNGHVHQVTLPDGGTLTYAYDTSGNLLSVQYPDGKSRQYVYNEPSLTGGANLPNAMTGIIDAAGTRYESTAYDSSGRAISSVFAGNVGDTRIAYNSDGTSTVQYPLGSSATLGFTMVNGLVRVASLNQPCGSTCDQPWKTRTYDPNGYPASYVDFNGNVTVTTYDSVGLLTQKIDAQGAADQRTIKIDWNTVLRVPLSREVIDASGATAASTAWVYNYRGEVHVRCEVDPGVPAAASYACSDTGTPPAGVRRWIYHYCGAVDTTQCPIVGLLLSVTGPRTDLTQTTTYAYYMLDGVHHRHGDLKSVTDPMGHVTTYLSYDGDGRVLSLQQPDGVYEDYTYTPRGWLASRTVRITPDNSPASSDATTTIAYWPYGAVKAITDPDGVVTAYTYDAAHRLTDITDATGERIHYTLDAAGNKVQEQVYTGAGTVARSLSRKYNPLGELTSVVDGLNQTVFSASYSDSYDADGNLVHSDDGLGVQQHRAYDALNRLAIAVADYNGSNQATANTTTAYAHDSLDRLVGVSDPSGLNTTYGYDGLGDATGLTSPDTGTTRRSFDAAGNVLTRTDAKGITASYTYDADNRLVAVSYPDASQDTAYHYDEPNATTGCASSRPVGRLTRIVEAAVTTVYCYGGHGNVAQKQQITSSGTDTTRYAYTPANRLSGITYPDGLVVGYTYNANGLLASVQATLTGTSLPVAVASNITWYPFGPISGYTLGNGQQVTRSYDANYRLTDLTSPAFSLHVARDAMGDITAMGNAPGANPATETYSYDPLYRLTAITEANGSKLESVTYNQTGDRLSKSGSGLATGAYSYKPGTHQLIATGNVARGVDADGNTTAISGAGGSYGYGYNDRSRLALVQLAGSTIASYTYNALGERIQKLVGSAGERYGYDERRQMLSEQGAKNRDYVWMGNIPIANVDTTASVSTISYVTADQLGTPRAISNASGATEWSWPYAGNAWGESAPTSTGYTYNLRFPGQYYDVETGMVYNDARYFDPATGRFSQSDPLGLFGGQASTYAYVGGNPLIHTDPAGLITWQQWLRIIYFSAAAHFGHKPPPPPPPPPPTAQENCQGSGSNPKPDPNPNPEPNPNEHPMVPAAVPEYTPPMLYGGGEFFGDPALVL